MNTTKILTYLLYALLAGLVLVAVYKTCEMSNRQKALNKETQELDQKRDLGYVDPDSAGTLYEGNDTSSVIIDDNSVGQPLADNAPTPPSPAAPAKSKGETATSPVSSPARSSESAPPPSEALDLDNDGRDGRYRVVAGSFTKLDGARREMQRIIKMGYTEAEIGYYNRGKFAVVVVKRTDNLNEANRIVDDLERRGIDAAVIDRVRKK